MLSALHHLIAGRPQSPPTGWDKETAMPYLHVQGGYRADPCFYTIWQLLSSPTKTGDDFKTLYIVDCSARRETCCFAVYTTNAAIYRNSFFPTNDRRVEQPGQQHGLHKDTGEIQTFSPVFFCLTVRKGYCFFPSSFLCALTRMKNVVCHCM